jgi:hypothetical protein
MAALEDKRIEVSLHAAAKAQAAQTLKHPTPGEDDGGNPDRRTPRSDKSLKDKELKEKENVRSMRRTRHVKTRSPSPRQRVDGVYHRIDLCSTTFD